METKDIDLLFEICDLYRAITVQLGVECKLDVSMVEDRLARLKSGEYIIIDNPKW